MVYRILIKKIAQNSVFVLGESLVGSCSWPKQRNVLRKNYFFDRPLWIFIKYSSWKSTCKHLLVAEIQLAKLMYKTNLQFTSVNF